jgi:hypothetical protein
VLQRGFFIRVTDLLLRCFRVHVEDLVVIG